LNILFVTKDKGPFNVCHKVVPELRSRGHNVQVIAEGLSADLWEKTGEKLVFKGTLDFTKEPFALDAATAFADLKSDVLVTTGSVPINLEQRFAEEAKARDIPIVVIEDTVGSATRLKMAPKLVLTLNQLAVDFYRAKEVLSDVTMEPIGSDYFKRLEFSKEKRKEVALLNERFDLLAHYSGQGRPFTREILALAIDSIRFTPEKRVGLIARHHPKKLPSESMAQIEQDLAALERDRPGSIIANSTLTSDEAASVCDFTFTCFGSALNFAAVHGKVPVCVMTPGCAKDLLEQTGFDATPLAAVGAALPMVESTSLITLQTNHTALRDKQRLYAQPFPFDPRLASDAIERVAS
jgi:hypothetical protein